MRLLGPFRAMPAGKVRAVLTDQELMVLQAVSPILRPVVEGDLSGEPEAERLLPSASRDDPEVAASFRAMAHDELVKAKLRAIDRFGEAVGEPNHDASKRKWIRDLDVEETAAWMSVLNDTRLVLGTRIGVTEDMYEELDEDLLDDPRHQMYWVLSELLGSLVQAASVAAGRGPVRVTRRDVESYEE